MSFKLYSYLVIIPILKILEKSFNCSLLEKKVAMPIPENVSVASFAWCYFVNFSVSDFMNWILQYGIRIFWKGIGVLIQKLFLWI